MISIPLHAPIISAASENVAPISMAGAGLIWEECGYKEVLMFHRVTCSADPSLPPLLRSALLPFCCLSSTYVAYLHPIPVLLSMKLAGQSLRASGEESPGSVGQGAR